MAPARRHMVPRGSGRFAQGLALLVLLGCGGQITTDDTRPDGGTGDAGAEERLDETDDVGIPEATADDVGLPESAEPDAGSDGVDEIPPLDCRNPWTGGTPVACCPDFVSCADKPDWYPGYDCVDRDQDRCSSHCSGGVWLRVCWGTAG
jgi:hypothetical protein